jgi:hypothetical protein
VTIGNSNHCRLLQRARLINDGIYDAFRFGVVDSSDDPHRAAPLERIERLDLSKFDNAYRGSTSSFSALTRAEAFLRRDPTLHDPPIQVGTPRRGNIQRINTT